ncbi:MAG: RluA family pseudouridine synthase [Thermoleophilaceae bacterium]
MSGVGFVAGEADAGTRLDAALASHGATRSRAEGRRLIEAGRVRVDGRHRRASHRLAAGETVAITPPEAGRSEPGASAPAAFEVVHEDDALLVVDKPAGVVVHPGAGHAHGTLVQALAGRVAGGPDPERAGIVHRLDRDTSGLMVLARTEAVHAALQQMIRERRIEREYLALVEGRPDARSGTIDAALGRDRERRTTISTRTDRPRRAVTHFELRERMPRTTLLAVWLETGRTHQIRAHLAAIGHPVCADARYGGGASGRRLGLTRQFLHSRRLMFTHPLSGEPVRCESEVPVDLLRTLGAARRDQASDGPDGDLS